MLFAFEKDFADSLQCIPMEVRLKLDTCGVKLKLVHWNKLSHEERLALIDRPCSGEEIAEYRDFLQNLITEKSGTPAGELAIDPHPPWLDDTTLPADVQTQAGKVGETITLAQWAGLTPLQRFALIKLSRSSHENANFLPAMKEFNLV